MLLRARTVYPVSSPPIEDGAVIIQNDKILEVGRFRDLSSSDSNQTDLGEVVLLPGLINAHCHLDYTGMAGMIRPPSDYLDWIESIIAIKAHWDYSDYADSWLVGARQLLATGTTTVADMEAVPELIPEVWSATPLRIHSFVELINVRGQQHLEDQVNEATDRLRAHPNPRGGLGLSPHAHYSTNQTLLSAASAKNLPLAIHVAESKTEAQMYREGKGRMFNWLQRNGRDMSDCNGESPVQLLHQLDLLNDRLLAVHCNYLDDHDIDLLGQQQVNVVHCPHSHAYFGHDKFRAEDLAKAGVNISLGTDSLATTRKKKRSKPTLNLFDEMSRFQDTNPSIAPESIVRMVTINGAKALGVEGNRGELKSNADADLLSIEWHGDTDSLPAAIVASAGSGMRSMIAGQWLTA